MTNQNEYIKDHSGNKLVIVETIKTKGFTIKHTAPNKQGYLIFKIIEDLKNNIYGGIHVAHKDGFFKTYKKV